MLLANLLKDITLRVNNAIVESYGLQDRVYSDGVGIVRWPIGLELSPHADNANNDGSSNGLDWRDFGTIVYLNDNFSGGEIYYSNLNLSIKPIACSMIVHPANEVYRHGVAEVISGTRYILSAFLTLPPIK